MHGYEVKNPIKVGRVFVVRGKRGVLPSVAVTVDGSWVGLLNSTGETRRIELVTVGRATSLPGYAATGVDLGGLLVEAGGRFSAARGTQRAPVRADRASALRDLQALLYAALLDMIGQQQEGPGLPPVTGEISRNEAAYYARVRPQSIDHHRARKDFRWRVEGGQVRIDAASFAAWLSAKQQREREDEHGQ